MPTKTINKRIKWFYIIGFGLLSIFLMVSFVLNGLGMTWKPDIWLVWLLFALLFLGMFTFLYRKVTLHAYHALLVPIMLVFLYFIFLLITFKGIGPFVLLSREEGNYIVVEKGFGFGSYDVYHEKVNCYLMKTKVEKITYSD